MATILSLHQSPVTSHTRTLESLSDSIVRTVFAICSRDIKIKFYTRCSSSVTAFSLPLVVPWSHLGSLSVAVCSVLSCILCTHVFGPNFQEKKSFNFLIQLYSYLYLETKPIIVFGGIILHMDIIIAFQSYTSNA